MDTVRKVVMFVLVLVVGIMIVTTLIPPAVDDVLDRPDTAGYTGLEQFLRLLPFLAIVGLVVGGLLLLFKRSRDDSGPGGDITPGLPPGYVRRQRLPWRR